MVVTAYGDETDILLTRPLPLSTIYRKEFESSKLIYLGLSKVAEVPSDESLEPPTNV
jgi:hypothetical protein